MNTNNNQINNNEQENDYSFAELFFKYISYWKFFGVSITVCMLLAFAYFRYATPQYDVVSKAVIKDEKKGQIGVDLTAFSDLGIMNQNSNVDNEIEVLKSKTLIKTVVDSLNIDVAYYQNGRIKKTEVYENLPIRIKLNKFKQGGTFTIDKKEDGKYIISSKEINSSLTIFPNEIFDSPWGMMTLYETKNDLIKLPLEIAILNPKDLPEVSITTLSKNSSVVELSIRTVCPAKGVDIINTLVDIYNQQAIDDKNFVATNTIHFIDDRLRIISGELKTAEKDVETYKQDKNLTDVQAEAGLYLTASGEYEKKISDVDVQISILNMISDYLNNHQNIGNAIPTNLGLTDPTIIALINTYNELLLEKNRTTVGMKQGNPLLQEYEVRISSLKENLLKGIGMTASSLKLTRAELSKQESLYSGKIRGLSTQEREARELYRQKEIKETLFIYLLEKREETGLSLALATPTAKIIDRASFDEKPVSPKKLLILIVALFFGFIIPICIIFLIDLLNYKISNKEELISVVKAPFLGSIPYTKKTSPFPVKDLRSAISEKIRIVSANLNFIIGQEPNKIISITSTTSGEGKSFFTRNLALSLAYSGNKTLLIDLDIHKSQLNNILEFKTEKGIAQYLADPNIQVQDIIATQGDWHKNLHIIPTKISPPNPAELLASKRLDDLFEYAKGNYDYIIVDTPPIGLVADAFRINQFANANIYVARANYTHKSSLLEIKELYENKRLYNMCCVLNAEDNTSIYGHQKGGYYSDDKKS